MVRRFLIIKLVAMILKPIVAALKEQAKKTPNPIDDAIVEMAETVLGIVSGEEFKEIIK